MDSRARQSHCLFSLVAAAALSACTPAEKFEPGATGINLIVQSDASQMIDQFEISGVAGLKPLFDPLRIPESPRALWPSGESVTILVDAAMAGASVEIQVKGYSAGDLVASETATVKIVPQRMVILTVILGSGCAGAGDCIEPGECEVLAGVVCELGQCVYPPAVAGLACDYPDDGSSELSGYCDSGECVECISEDHCDDPPGGYADCFDISCTADGTCAYQPLPDVVCEEVGCRDGQIALNERVCGEEGLCPDTGTESCGGYACATEDTCQTVCADDADCYRGTTEGYFCRAPTCVSLLANGESCVGDGDHACWSGNCGGGAVCCASGDCCLTPASCPSAYIAASTCDDVTSTTSCQGTREAATCIDFVCGSEPVEDDSGCDGLSHACPDHIASIICTNGDDQSEPECPSDCTGVGCEAGYTCESGVCELQAGVGNSCTGTGQGDCLDGLKCENGVCCLAAGSTCCTDSVQCANGLACNSGVSSCFDTCTDYDNTQCASSADYCLSNACAAKKDPGSACDNGNECQSTFCVDGVCCESACGETCAACSEALTGLDDGSCRAIVIGEQDMEPSDSCTAAGVGCTGGTSCACDGAGTGTTHCLLAPGQTCSAGSSCASGICECGDTQCQGASKLCAVGLCPACEYTTTGTNCVNGLGDPGPIDDPEDCTGTSACYDGACLRDNGQGCGLNSQCLNTCIAAICADRARNVELSTPDDACDVGEDDDCVGADQQCGADGVCRYNDTAICSGADNSQRNNSCANTCVYNGAESQHECVPMVANVQSGGGTCEETADCAGSDQTCDAADDRCRLNVGQACIGATPTAQNDSCLNTCINDSCALPASTGDLCDTDDSQDCEVNHTCVGSSCRLQDGQSCAANSDCVGVCVNLTCAPLGGAGADCDASDDCQSGMTCLDDLCVDAPAWSADMISWWRLDESSGAAVDCIGSNDGTVTGATQSSPGKSGTAYDFDGNDPATDFISLPDVASLQMGSKDFTYAAWIRPRSYSGDNNSWRGIIGGEGGAASFGLQTDGSLRLTQVSTADAPDSALIAPLDQWSFVAVTFDSSSSSDNLTYYLNATSEAVTFDVDFTADAASNLIGVRASTADPFDGTLDEVMMWNTVLSAAQLLEVFRYFEAVPTDGLVGYWPFDESSGVTANDASGNGNHGTLTNGPDWRVDFGRVGGALEFDGVDDDDVVTVLDEGADDYFDMTTELSISLWVMLFAEPSWRMVLVDKGYYEYKLMIRETSHIHTYTANGAGSYEEGIMQPHDWSSQLNQWVHLAWTLNGFHEIIYVNGVEVGSDDFTELAGTVGGDSDVTIGQRTDTYEEFEGLIDEVRIYNRALTAAEVAILADQHNILRNSGFEIGEEGWSFHTDSTGSFAAGGSGFDGDNAAVVELTTDSSNMQLFQIGTPLAPNTQYLFSFAGYSSSGNDVQVQIIKHTADYDNYGINETYDLSTTWQTFSTVFTTPAVTTDPRVDFWFAGLADAGDIYYIDSVELRPYP